ncbi:MAG: DUF4435 domain-containing protein [Methanoregula sp.]
MDICDNRNPLKPTPHEIRTEIQLQREDQLYKGSFILVEGSPDSRLYKKFFDKKKSSPIIACGKEKIVEVFSLLTGNYNGIIGIADADFDHILDKKNLHNNLFLTELHDIESIIIRSNALEAVLSEYADEKKVEEFEAQNKKDLRQILLDSSLYLGYLRQYNEFHKKYWDFKTLPYSQIISTETFELNKKNLHNELQKINLQKPINDALLQRLSDIFDEKIDDPQNFVKRGKGEPWQMCRGHDLVAILYQGFIKKFGTDQSKNWKDIRSLEEVLRIAYNEHLFKQTGLYESIRQWETQNIPFIVLKNEEIEV